MTQRKISSKTLFNSWRIWFFWHGSSQQAESLLGNAFGHALSPVIKELYADNKEERINAYKRSLTLFNTEQQVGAICPGIVCGLEEAKVNGHVNSDVISSVKVALIGPTSAIGDSLWVATLIPIFLTITLSITDAAGDFGWIGPLLFMIAYPLGTALMSWKLWKLGYKTGVEGIHRYMSSGKIDYLSKAMTVLGLLVVGALSASFVNMSIPVSITPVGGEASVVELDRLINQIFPSLLPLGLTVFIYWLYSKKKWAPIKIMGLVLVFSVILTALGYLTGVY